MTTYSTHNPLGSSDPRDLYDNAENLDNFVNGSQPAYADRLGKARKSWAGMEQDFDDFLASSGYQFIGDYAAGIEVTEYNQIIREAGEFWRAAADAELPYTTTGAGMPEGGAFVAVGDAALRQELASPSGAALVGVLGPDGEAITLGDLSTPIGAAMVGRGTMTVTSIADLVALPEGLRKPDLSYCVVGFYAGAYALAQPQLAGGGSFIWDASRPKADHNGGTVISPTVPSFDDQVGADFTGKFAGFLSGSGETDPSGTGCFVKMIGDKVSAYEFGLSESVDITDASLIINHMMRSLAQLGVDVFIPAGNWQCLDTVEVPTNMQGRLVGEGKRNTLLNFASSSVVNCVTVGGTTNSVRQRVGGFGVMGRRNETNGLVLNPGGASGTPVTRGLFFDLRLYQHDISLKTTYAWYCQFDGVEMGNCRLGWEGGNQSNAMLFNLPIFGDCELAFSMSNCEGCQMNTPGIQDTMAGSRYDYVFMLSQSHLVMTNPYIESIGSQKVARVSSAGSTLPSSLIIDGGIWPPGGEIEYRGPATSVIRVVGPRTAGRAGGLSITSGSSYMGLNASSDFRVISTDPVDLPLLISAVDYRNAGSTPNATAVDKGRYWELTATSLSTRTIASQLEVGEYYTLVGVVSNMSGSVALRQSGGGNPTTTLAWAALESSKGMPVYTHFRATGTTLQLLMDSGVSLRLHGVYLYKGTCFPSVDVATIT